MAEKRKPERTILLRKQGKPKAIKIELFPRRLFPLPRWQQGGKVRQYRIRLNGKWWPPAEELAKNQKPYYTLSEVMVLVRKSLLGRGAKPKRQIEEHDDTTD